MKIGIKIMPRDVLLDTQGRAVAAHFKSQGSPVSDCRIGKFIEIEIDSQDQARGRAEIEKILNNGLYNPLIEKFEILD